MAIHDQSCKDCLCYTCKRDTVYCCWEHDRDIRCCMIYDCPDYEPEEAEGEDE